MSQLQAIAAKLRALAEDASPLASNVQSSARHLDSLSQQVESLARSGVNTGPLLAALQQARAHAQVAADAAAAVRADGVSWANYLATGGGGGGSTASYAEASAAAVQSGSQPARGHEAVEDAESRADVDGLPSDGNGGSGHIPESPEFGNDQGLSILDAALFAAAAYGRHGELPAGARLVSDDAAVLARVGLDVTMLRPEASNFRADLFDDGRGGLVVSFRGTRIFNKEDWRNNLVEAFTGDSEYYERAVKIAKTLRATVGVSHVQFVGHSLGGGMAAVAGATVGARTITFNQAPVVSKRIQSLPDSAVTTWVTSVQMGWDVVSRLPGTLGRVVTIEGHRLRLFKSHSIRSMVSALLRDKGEEAS